MCAFTYGNVTLCNDGMSRQQSFQPMKASADLRQLSQSKQRIAYYVTPVFYSDCLTTIMSLTPASTVNPSPIQLRWSIVSYEIGPVIGFNRDRMISSDLLRSSFPLNRSLNQIRMFPTVGTILKCSTTHLSSATWPEMSHVHLTSSRLMLKNPFRINFAIIS